MKLVDCDGGAKDDSYAAANVLLTHDDTIGMSAFVNARCTAVVFCFEVLFDG